MPARKTARPRKSEIDGLIRDAFERAGRAGDKGMLREALQEAASDYRMGPDFRGGDAREMAASAISSTGLRLSEGDGPLEILPSGRDPSVAQTLGVLAEEARRLQVRLDSIHQESDGLSRRAVERRLAAEGRKVPEDLDIGSHFCDGSPVGVCCYDADEDPSLDDCLFCHGPDERK
jgi:hypothetical protein